MAGVGVWSFTVHHAYDPIGKVLYQGDGTRRSVNGIASDVITTVAGTGVSGYSGDGGPATQAQLHRPQGVALGPDGSLYIADRLNWLVRRVGPDGIITTVAGGGVSLDDGVPATQAGLNDPTGVALGPDGSLYIADFYNARIRKVTPALSGFSTGQIGVASEDGTQLYQFDATGRHLKTLHALTGATLYEFSYDAAGRLVQVKDGDNNITTIEREGNGDPTVIIGPFGQRTTLTADANGYLASIANPAGETYSFTYTADGLMTAMQDPKDNAYQFTYDALGRLTRDDDPAGGSQSLSRVELGDAGFPPNNSGTSYEVTRTTALNRATNYRVAYPSAGELAGAQTREVLTNTFPDGTTSKTTSRLNGMEEFVAPQGTTATVQEGPNPRFGMQASIPTSTQIRTPGNLTLDVNVSREITPENPSSIFNFTSLKNEVSIKVSSNIFRKYTSVFDKAGKIFTSTTPEQRTSTATIDEQGRVT